MVCWTCGRKLRRVYAAWKGTPKPSTNVENTYRCDVCCLDVETREEVTSFEFDHARTSTEAN